MYNQHKTLKVMKIHNKIKRTSKVQVLISFFSWKLLNSMKVPGEPLSAVLDRILEMEHVREENTDPIKWKGGSQ